MNMNYIREIAEALSENHAALMVGAGFSKNAEKVSITDKKFLNWNELSDLFYETVYGKEGPGKQYNSSLRLAQEVEITVGRPKLEKIIKDAVPDLEYAPSEVYVKLMEMPWKDVFTTNYDTLLERAADKVTNRRYNVVICQEDLVNSNNAPRILKLHGSFPSYRPFIITEEDYRTYPVKFAAMVNTVQQALLENVFCMLGFSCEDPNFIKWIGWIHDNLGKSSSQKIYMVSVTHIAEAKRKLLFERNIIVIDLQELWPDKNIGDRLNSFLEGNIVDETEECIHESDVSWWNENDKYCLYLNTEEKGNKSFETKDNFDLSSTYTMHMGRDNSNVFYALEYLRFLEQTGHPFRLQNVTNTKGLHSTVKLLAPYYPHWCLMQILIAQDNKHIDLMFGRVKLYELSQKEVDDIAKEYLRIFQIVMKNVKPENFFFAKSIYEQSAVVLPDIIAGLCYKCSINILDEIFDSILDLCLSNVRTNFKGIRKIFKGLFEAFSLQDQENRIEKILQFPVDVDRMSDYCDPIVFISKPREKYVLDIEIYNRILFQIKQTIKEAENEKRQAAVNRLVILAQVIILNEEDLRYLCKVLEKEETLENKSILYVLDKQKYEKNKKEIFEDTLKRMKSDSNTQMFSAGGNNYRDLIGILNDIDISKINLEEALEVLTNLVKTNQSWVERNQPNASERIRQSFLIVMGLIILRESKNIDLSETEKEKVYAYFEALSELYKNSIAIDMIEACFVDDSKFYFEDFQNKIWLSNEQELGLIKDFYDVLYINDFKLQNNDMLLKCSNMLFRISIYRVISSEILHNMAALKLCYAIIKNEIVLKTEIQTLLVCLLKLQDETVIKQTDSEQEALYKLRCRIISCKIAKELYVRGIKSDIVDGWKRISENKNEFIEIRNVVFDTTGDE